MHVIGRVFRHLASWVEAVALAAAKVSQPAGAETLAALPRELVILHLMSYHSPWLWTDGLLQSFEGGLAAARWYRTFQVDAKRQSTPEQLQARTCEDRARIAHWKPDWQ